MASQKATTPNKEIPEGQKGRKREEERAEASESGDEQVRVASLVTQCKEASSENEVEVNTRGS